MKTFAVVAIACLAVFVGTAIYLLVGGEGAHVAKSAIPAPPANATATAVENPRVRPAKKPERAIAAEPAAAAPPQQPNAKPSSLARRERSEFAVIISARPILSSAQMQRYENYLSGRRHEVEKAAQGLVDKKMGKP